MINIPGLKPPESRVPGLTADSSGRLTSGTTEAPDFSSIVNLVMKIREHEQRQELERQRATARLEAEQRRWNHDAEVAKEERKLSTADAAEKQRRAMLEAYPQHLQSFQSMAVANPQQAVRWWGQVRPGEPAPEVPGGFGVPGAGVVYPGLIPKPGPWAPGQAPEDDEEDPDAEERRIAQETRQLEDLQRRYQMVDPQVAHNLGVQISQNRNRSARFRAAKDKRARDTFDMLSAAYVKENGPDSLTEDVIDRLHEKAAMLLGDPSVRNLQTIKQGLENMFGAPAPQRQVVRSGKMY